MTSLRDLVRSGLSAFASHPALIHGQRAMTFAELDTRAAIVTGSLRRTGLPPRPLVAVCIERSFDLYAAIISPVLVGGAYLPLSPAEPDVRLRSMIDRARPAAILTTSALRYRFSSFSIPVIAVDELLDDRSVPVPWETFPPVAPLDAAYVMFTSGSTGEPKGAVIPNRAIVNRLEWMARALEIDEDDMLIQKTPVTFDVSLWELFLPFVTGAPLVIPEPGAHRDVSAISRLVKEHGVTVIHFVPSTFHHYLRLDSLEEEASSLRIVVTSGEALTTDLRDRCLDRIPQARLFNLYGPTEAAVDVTFWECKRNDPYRTVPIGRAIDHVDLHVLDEERRPVAPGERGELYIGGIAVGNGYVNDPVRTAESFVDDTLCGVPGRMLYRTGDIVTVDTDDVLEFIGRRDFQVKIRGIRVELGEVESALRATGTVIDCLASTIAEQSGSTLIAYVVPPNDAPFDEATCRSSLRGLVPDCLIPSVFVVLDSLPLTEHGKIDRKRLPIPTTGTAMADAESDIPELHGSDASVVIHGIWREVLGRDNIPVDLNFFDAGGTSLSILRLPKLIEERTGVTVRVSDLFGKPTIAALSAFVTDRKR